MNVNPINVTTINKNRSKKHKKSKNSTNELLNLSNKSSKTLLKAIQIAKEETNYFKNYYQLNFKNENIENENNTNSPLTIPSRYQQQFLQILLNQNNKKYNNRNAYESQDIPSIAAYSQSPLFPSSTIVLPKHYYQPQIQQQHIYHQCHPSPINNCVNNTNANNINKYSHDIHNINLPNSQYVVSNSNTKFTQDEIVSNCPPIPQQYQLKSSISSNRNSHHDNVKVNDTKSNYKYHDESQFSVNSYHKEFNKQNFNKSNSNIKDSENVKKNVTINENKNRNYYSKEKKENSLNNVQDMDLEKLLKIQTMQYEEIKRLKSYILSDSSKSKSNGKKNINEEEKNNNENIENSSSEYINNKAEFSAISNDNYNSREENNNSYIQESQEYSYDNNEVFSDKYNESPNLLYNKKYSSKVKNIKNATKSEEKPKFQININEKQVFKSRSGLLSKHTIKNDIKKSDDALRKSDAKLRKLTKKVPICVPNYKPKINTYHPKKKIHRKINSNENNNFSYEELNDVDDDVPIKLNNNEKKEDIKKVVEEAIKEILNKELLKNSLSDNKMETIIDQNNYNTIKLTNFSEIVESKPQFPNKSLNSNIPNFIIDDTLDTTKLENINNNLNTSFENIEDISAIIYNKDIDFTIDDEISRNISKEIENFKDSQADDYEKSKKELNCENLNIIKLPEFPNVNDSKSINYNVTHDDQFIRKMERIASNNVINDTTKSNRDDDKITFDNDYNKEDTNSFYNKMNINEEFKNEDMNNEKDQNNDISDNYSSSYSDKDILRKLDSDNGRDSKNFAKMKWKSMKKEIQQEINTKLKENKKLKKNEKQKKLKNLFINLNNNSNINDTESFDITSFDSSSKSANSSLSSMSHLKTAKEYCKKRNKLKKLEVSRDKIISSRERIYNKEKDFDKNLKREKILEESLKSEIINSDINEDSTYSSTFDKTEDDNNEESFDQNTNSLSYFFYNPNLKVKRIISNPMVKSFIDSRNKNNRKVISSGIPDETKNKKQEIELSDPEKQINVIRLSALMKKNIMQGRERFLNYLNENSLNGFGCGTFPDDLKMENNAIENEIYSVFNPWEIIESISDFILDEIIEENAEEINHNLDQFIEDLFNEEFNPTNE